MCLGSGLLAVCTCSPWAGLGPWLYFLLSVLNRQLQGFASTVFSSHACHAEIPLLCWDQLNSKPIPDLLHNDPRQIPGSVGFRN